jgi:hypothetical protein
LATISVLGAALTPMRKHVVTFFHPQDCLDSADISLLRSRACDTGEIFQLVA